MFFSCNTPRLVLVCLSKSMHLRRLGKSHVWHMKIVLWNGMIPVNVVFGHAPEIVFRILVSLGRFFSVIFSLICQKFPSALDAAGVWEWSGSSSRRWDPFAQGHTCWMYTVWTSIAFALNLSTWISDVGCVLILARPLSTDLQSKLSSANKAYLINKPRRTFGSNWCGLLCFFFFWRYRVLSYRCSKRCHKSFRQWTKPPFKKSRTICQHILNVPQIAVTFQCFSQPFFSVQNRLLHWSWGPFCHSADGSFSDAACFRSVWRGPIMIPTGILTRFTKLESYPCKWQ